MQITYLKLIFTDVIMKPHNLPKLRGYFSQKYKEHPKLHNHLPGGKFSYSFPKIQYRIIDNHPALLGFGEGFDIIKRILFDSDEIIINNRSYHVHEKSIMVEEAVFGKSDKYIKYKFTSPWMGLNAENHKKYLTLNPIEQQQFLKNLLRGNLKTLAKGFDYWIEDFESIQIEGYFKPLQVNFKNRKMLCFTGEFTINFHIPDWLGLGKQSARGFGVVVRIL